MNLTVDDFKSLLFEIWMTQRENAQLRQRLAEAAESASPAGPSSEDGN